MLSSCFQLCFCNFSKQYQNKGNNNLKVKQTHKSQHNHFFRYFSSMPFTGSGAFLTWQKRQIFSSNIFSIMQHEEKCIVTHHSGLMHANKTSRKTPSKMFYISIHQIWVISNISYKDTDSFCFLKISLMRIVISKRLITYIKMFKRTKSPKN